MPTAVEIKNKSNADIRNKTAPGSISNVDHADINNMIVDYVDQEVDAVGTEVVLQITRDGGTNEYSVTDIKNNTGITFTAADASTNGVGITASAPFFVNSKVFSPNGAIHNAGQPYIYYDNGYATPVLRAIYFYNVATQASSRPASLTIRVSFTVYP